MYLHVDIKYICDTDIYIHTHKREIYIFTNKLILFLHNRGKEEYLWK